MNAAFGNDIVKLEVADLAGRANGRTTEMFPLSFKIAAVDLIAAAFTTLMLKPNDTRDCFWSANTKSCTWVQHP